MNQGLMTASDVVEIVDALQRIGVTVWLDGGWAVDALLGTQTREHEDLDVVVSLEDTDLIQKELGKNGFAGAEDELPTRLVLADGKGRRIDLHTVAFDSEGGGVQKLQDGRSYRYPPEGFKATGEINGRHLKCLTAKVQAQCHYGYEPDEKDIHDMKLLHERFNIKLYPPYL